MSVRNTFDYATQIFVLKFIEIYLFLDSQINKILVYK